ncbi:putative dipeptide/oligopeptide/nickel ABC-type transport system periplasmic component [Salmonella enterica subsp. enterica]|uniref:Putative dipeptide/oligopeptide/nickel ABC-type transport system periplasmic component n=1 Tax=Salmonella enterica I TaxID=59201 RepID=A0A447TXC1_SALET|nr:putative dipeptide/oligopeptide/nickel ABC-type transport system periplasmic component [Salmonella enterica subsp. enterica]
MTPFRAGSSPDIAHYWTHNEDFTRWEFWLKSTARFADGCELDASAVQRCLLAASQSPQFRADFQPNQNHYR